MTVILTSADCEQLIDMSATIAAVESVFGQTALGRVVLPVPSSLQLPAHTERFLPMSAVAEEPPLAVVKLLADLPDHAGTKLPTQRSVIVLTDAGDGTCRAILAGRIPTRERTAAASAVATKHLARPDSRVLGLVGAGALATAHLRSQLEVRSFEHVVIWSRSETSRLRCLDTAERIIAESGRTVRCEAVADLSQVFATADVICTLTPSKEPLIQGTWLRPGQHLNVVGAPPRADHRETDDLTIGRATVFVDDLGTALAKSGDICIPIENGTVDVTKISNELGDVVAGKITGRGHPSDITLFNSVGLGSQDLAIGHLYLERAEKLGIGMRVDLAG